MLERDEIVSLVKDEMMKDWECERERLDLIDCWYRWKHDEIKLPRAHTPEMRSLAELSKVPWLGLVVKATAQCLFVDGYRSELDPVSDDGENADGGPPATPWRIWLANGWDHRQIAVHRAMLAYGYAFATVIPGMDPITRENIPVIRGISPRRMWAAYEDPAQDDWPEYAIQVLSKYDAPDKRIKVYDEVNVYTCVVHEGSDTRDLPAVEILKTEVHDAGVCPVVRYCADLDLEGRSPGEVEPFISTAARINKTSFDRMLVQHFNSWKVRYATGMAEPDTEEGARLKAMQLKVQDMLISEDPDTKFGTLEETQMAGFIAAHEADVHTLAAVSQTPTHELTGDLVNLSAEALAAARASHTQKVYEVQKSAGRSHAQMLRLASHIAGDEAHAKDVTGRVTWQDTSIRSMAQAVDALGKMVTMMGVPATETWSRIPGVEKSDVEQWKRVAREHDPINQMQMQLERQATPPDAPADVVPGA